MKRIYGKEICNNGILKYADPEKIILEIREKLSLYLIIVSGIVKVMRCDGCGNGILLNYLAKKQSSAIEILDALEHKDSEIRIT